MAANPSSDDLLGDHTPSELMENMMFLARELQLIGPEPHTQEYIDRLPAVNEAQLRRLEQLDSSCPICLIPFSAVIAEEETASAMESPAYADQDMGVTRLKNVVEGEAGCGHIFCRKDISRWIATGHTSCPTCRTPFLRPAEPQRRNSSRGTEPRPNVAINSALPDVARLLDGGDDEELNHILQEMDHRLLAVLQGQRPAHPTPQRPSVDYDQEFIGMYT